MGFIASLLIRLGGDSSGFRKAAKEAESDAKSLAREVNTLFRGYLSGAAAIATIKQSLDFAGQLKDITERLEIGAVSAQQFFESAKRGGQDISNVAQAMDKMRDTIGEAFGDPNKMEELRSNLEQFGVSIDGIGNSEETFRAILSSMAEGGTSAEKFAAGVDLLGKQYGKLIPMAKEFQGMQGRGGLFSAEEIDQMDAAGDALTSFGIKVKTTIGRGIAGWGMILPGGIEREAARMQAVVDREAEKGLAIAADFARRKADAEFAEKEKAAAKHMKAMDEVSKMEAEAAAKEEQAIDKRLSKRERELKLMERKTAIETHLANAPAELSDFMQQANAALRLELAEINLKLADAGEKGSFTKPSLDGSARQGLFLGGRNDPLVDINRQQLSVLRSIDRKVGNNSDPVAALNRLAGG